MIVITGAGRSGTSLVARAYQQAGMDPGGEWSESTNAGLEDPGVVALNRRIVTALGASLMGLKSEAPSLTNMGLGPIARAVGAVTSEETRYRWKRRYERRSGNRQEFSVIEWQRVNEVAASMRSELCDFARQHAIVKDPLFCLTMPVWLASGADISSAIVMTRNVSDMIMSRSKAGHLGFRSESDARNSLIYAVGNLVTSLLDFDVRFEIVRFPDVLRKRYADEVSFPVPVGFSAVDVVAALQLLGDRKQVRSSRQDLGPT